ncbi:hypothetical protein [Tepidibacter hydrothermalis]|uniref:Phage protein n=1 Tax=Tepidibacter hydrothermalis TaxID=3036126 RepID=A0ABY8E932_9FIRM|nr:hypothetical protein [Tepidibacter hydrothermalis]WFD09422.1 hypothetical protein P4S50_13630 [Tepidibacter hydrothermalis]
MRFLKIMKYILGIWIIFRGIYEIVINYPSIDHWKNLAVILVVLYLIEPIVDKKNEEYKKINHIK